MVPNSTFGNGKTFDIIWESPFGIAPLRMAVGKQLSIEEPDTDDIPCSDTSSDIDVTMSVKRLKRYDDREITSPWMVDKSKRKHDTVWPSSVDLVKGGGSMNYICSKDNVNQRNLKLVRRLLLWKQEFIRLVNDVKETYSFSGRLGSEQLAITDSVNEICNCIAATELPTHIMGCSQILEYFKYPKTMQEAELVGNIAEYGNFELTAHLSMCETTFFVVTTHFHGDHVEPNRIDIRRVIYGLYPVYQGGGSVNPVSDTIMRRGGTVSEL